MPIAKLRPAFTFTEDRLAELRAVVPEVFADGAVNWEALREALGAYLEDEGRDAEHFGLTWPGKREARRLAAQPSKGTLIPAPGEGVDEASTRNLFIEGDNLEVLKLLQKSYAGRVKLIYIDPPYNTGNDFVYKDNFSEPLEDYLRQTGQMDDSGEILVSNTRAGGRLHAKWITMMYPRLMLSRQLLREDGVIFVSIDDNEVHNLRQMMNEVFGEENFVATIVWQKRVSPDNDERHITATHDYLVCFARSTESTPIRGFDRSVTQDERYSNLDNDSRGPWTSSDLTRREYRPQDFYKIKLPSGREVEPSRGRSWAIPKSTFERLIAENRIWFGPDQDSMPRRKRFLSEVGSRIVPVSWFSRELSSDNQTGKREVKEIFSEVNDVFQTPKPTILLRTLIKMSTFAAEEDLVLDFFAGSATTAHAVLEQNREDHGNRRFILVQLPEETGDERLPTIAEIGKERIRRVIKRMRQEAKRKLDLEDRATPEDLGFRVYKLGRSNYKAWQDYHGDSVEALETLFDRIETPLVDNWKPEHVLSEVLLLQGFPLDSTVTAEASFKHNHIQRVASDAIGHRLFVCLDGQITDATIGQLMLAPEDVFVCLDSALTDEAKLRLADRCTLRVI